MSPDFFVTYLPDRSFEYVGEFTKRGTQFRKKRVVNGKQISVGCQSKALPREGEFRLLSLFGAQV